MQISAATIIPLLSVPAAVFSAAKIRRRPNAGRTVSVVAAHVDKFAVQLQHGLGRRRSLVVFILVICRCSSVAAKAEASRQRLAGSPLSNSVVVMMLMLMIFV